MTNQLRQAPLELVLVGAGGRGFHAYGAYAKAHPSASDSLVSHLLAFAAEEARVSQRVVEMSAYLEQVGVADLTGVGR